ncbi:MAG: class I SAM-dependent methyltransferase [Deltaproteobacteria bacterium]|nr:class I SAM-dependent methyltransferase [Deltaproteobacteria bacterium]
MKSILCPLCEVDRTAFVSRRRRQNLTVTTVICLECGLVYHNPVIEDSDRRDTGATFQAWHTDARPSSRYFKKLEARWARQWPLVGSVFTPGCRVLEIGAGLGVVSAHLKRLGAKVLSVEPDPAQAAYAREHWDLTVVQARFEDVDLTGEQFDLILSSHAIEHFQDPLNFLAKVRTLAHPETALFLETPNILAPKVSPVRLFSVAHNFYFSPWTLSLLLEKGGWQVSRRRIFRRDAFQLLARPAPPRRPAIPSQAVPLVQKALNRHRYLYYLKLLFLWRKIPWWQTYWMYTDDPRYDDIMALELS